ncbi:MAG: rpsA [Thermoleophilia bacterium]|nr:rpsA [Thermoleophilia bacterium]
MATVTIESVVTERPADTAGWIEVEGGWIPDYEANLRDVTEGEVTTGIVVRIDNDEVLVDIGYKSEGVIPANELSIRRNVDPRDEVELGEEVDALVLTKEDADGRLILSKKRARFEKAWRRIEAAAEAGEIVTGRVIEVVKGGLILDLGVRGFLPASLVDIRRVQDLLSFLDTDIEAKVIELNRSRNNVVLSRRAVLEEERREVRQRILDHLNVGDVVEGQISNIVEFGAFVDLEGIDGLIHISELSWSHVNHPGEVIEIGQTVQVKVLDIDRDRQRISLGLKQTREDPWQKVLNDYQVGDELEGVVTKAVTFGAFVELFPGVEGLVHISELSWEHVENPREVVNPGDKVKAKLIEIDAERRRISLSIKQTTERPADLPADDDFVPIDASGEGLDLDGPSTSMAAALREAAARANEPEEGTEAAAVEAPADDAPAADEADADAPAEAAVEAELAETPAEELPVEVEDEVEAPAEDVAAEAAEEAAAGEDEA